MGMANAKDATVTISNAEGENPSQSSIALANTKTSNVAASVNGEMINVEQPKATSVTPFTELFNPHKPFFWGLLGGAFIAALAGYLLSTTTSKIAVKTDTAINFDSLAHPTSNVGQV